MPKAKNTNLRLKNYVTSFENEGLSTDGSVLFCKFCSKKIGDKDVKKSQIEQHVKAAKHKANVQLGSKRQQLFHSGPTTSSESSSDGDKFSMDICEAFTAADIPLYKLSNQPFRAFLEQYCGRRIPDESTLRKNYLQRCYQNVIEEIRSDLEDQYIWISIDESTDATGRYIAHCIVGSLSTSASRSYLLHSDEIPKVNHSVIAKFIMDSLTVLWPNGIKYNMVLLIVTDAAAYMLKGVGGLGVLFPKMRHLTCLAHGLHRLAEFIRTSYPEVDNLISEVKKVFIKSPYRCSAFKQFAPDICIPPQPVITRWGTWISAAIYYAKHFDLIKEVLSTFDSKAAVSIRKALDLLNRENIKMDLACIQSNFSSLPNRIESLESQGRLLSDSIAVINDLQNSLNKVSTTGNSILQGCTEKLRKILSKNPGFKDISQISSVLNGTDQVDPKDIQGQLSPAEIANFKYAPVTSCDVERSFSRLKNLLSDRRQRTSSEHLKWLLILQANKN